MIGCCSKGKICRKSEHRPGFLAHLEWPQFWCNVRGHLRAFEGQHHGWTRCPRPYNCKHFRVILQWSNIVLRGKRLPQTRETVLSPFFVTLHDKDWQENIVFSSSPKFFGYDRSGRGMSSKCFLFPLKFLLHVCVRACECARNRSHLWYANGWKEIIFKYLVKFFKALIYLIVFI